MCLLEVLNVVTARLYRWVLTAASTTFSMKLVLTIKCVRLD
jgi:hypothetical protein